MNKRSSPVGKRSYSQILDNVARDGLAANTDLAPRILAQVQKGKRATMQPRMRVLVISVLVLLILVSALVSVPSVRAAIQRWIGYVPEVGLVGEGQLRTIAEPVSITRDGITLTIEQMWVASDRTLIQYSVEGWPWGTLAANPPSDGCLEPAILRLPDGELSITQPQSSFGRESGYELKILYPAIPPAVDEVTFVMPCLILASTGEAPENWEVPLRLIPAPSDAVFPVIEISTPDVFIPVEATATVSSETNASAAADAVSITFDRAVQMDDGYLIYVSLHWDTANYGWAYTPDPTTLHLLDANEQEVSFEIDYDATIEAESTAAAGQTSFAIKTVPLQTPGPLSLVLDSVIVDIAVDARFTFDPGPDPKPGQVWELNQEIDLLNGHSLRVLRVKYDLTDGVQAYLSFDMESETGVTYAGLLDKAHPLTGTAGGGNGASLPGPFTSDLYYLEPLPKGPLTIDIMGISVYMPGHWEATWTPPAQ